MSKQSNQPSSLSELYAQLDAILAWFNQDDFDLDQALTKFEEGMQLVAEIRKRLETTEHKITVLKERFDRQAGQL